MTKSTPEVVALDIVVMALLRYAGPAVQEHLKLALQRLPDMALASTYSDEETHSIQVALERYVRSLPGP